MKTANAEDPNLAKLREKAAKHAKLGASIKSLRKSRRRIMADFAIRQDPSLLRSKAALFLYVDSVINEGKKTLRRWEADMAGISEEITGKASAVQRTGNVLSTSSEGWEMRGELRVGRRA